MLSEKLLHLNLFPANALFDKQYLRIEQITLLQ